jgi:predicted  nucleic acid-binding Zn-ribbon protein
MAANVDRLKVLGIAMRAIDQLSPAVRVARAALAALRQTASTAFSAMTAPARLFMGAIKGMLRPLFDLRGLLAGLGAAFTVRSFHQIAAEMDQVGKSARALGVDVETMQELGHVARITGADVEAMVKAMRQAAVVVGQAERGQKSATNALEELGLSARELRALDPADQLAEIGSALAGLGENTDRVRVAQQLFGRQSLEVLKLTDAQGESLKALREEAHDLGIVVDRDTIRVFEEWMDAWERVKSAIKGLMITVSVEFLPLMLEAAGHLKEFFVTRRDDIREWAHVVAANLRFAGGAIAAFATMIRELIGDPKAADVLGDVLKEVADLAIDIARETALAVLKILKSVFEVAVQPLLTLVSIVAEEIGAHLNKGVVASVIKLPNLLLKGIEAGFRALPDALQGMVGKLFGENFVGALRMGIPSGLADILADQLAGDIVGLKDRSGEVKTVLGRLIRDLTATINREVNESSETLKALLAGYKASIAEFVADIGAIDHPAVSKFLARIKELEVELEAAKDHMKEAGAAAKEMGAAVADAGKQVAISSADIASINDLMAEAEVMMSTGRTRDLKELEFAYQRDVAAKAESIRDLQGQEEAFQQWALARQQEYTEQRKEIDGTWWDGAKRAAKDWAQEVAHQFKNGYEAMRAVIDVVQQGFGQAFSDLISGAKSAGEVFKQMGREVLQVIAKIIAQQAALAVTKLFFAGFGLARGGIVQGGMVPIMEFARGGLTPGRGGIVDRPTLAMIGEGRQREAVIPLPDGRRVEAIVQEPLQPQAGQVNVTFEIHANDTAGFDRLLVQRRDLIENLVRTAMATKRNFRDTVRSIAR